MRKITLILLSALISACATLKEPSVVTMPNKTISATGYGTVEKNDKYSKSQIKLMAMRASKMDAYRSLAEQLHGIKLQGKTSVENMEVTSDSYQVFLDAYLRGARVKRTTVIGSDIYAGDDTFETVVELDLTPEFYGCLSNINQCHQQKNIPSNDMQKKIESQTDKVSVVSKKTCNGDTCYNYPHVSGFNH